MNMMTKIFKILFQKGGKGVGERKETEMRGETWRRDSIEERLNLNNHEILFISFGHIIFA